FRDDATGAGDLQAQPHEPGGVVLVDELGRGQTDTPAGCGDEVAQRLGVGSATRGQHPHQVPADVDPGEAVDHRGQDAPQSTPGTERRGQHVDLCIVHRCEEVTD